MKSGANVGGGSSPVPVLMLARVLAWGGIERDISKFARHLHAYGIAPHVGCFRPGGVRWNEIEAAGIPIVHIPLTSFKSPSVITAAAFLRRYVTEHRIQVLHAFDATANLFGAPVARLLGLPSLTSQLWCRDFLPRLMQRMLLASNRLSNCVFVNSYAVAEDLCVKGRIRRDRIHVCHNGFEPDVFHPQGRKRPPALADASIVIGTVAVLREEKNLPLLLEAFVQVHAKDHRARLVIVGSGPMKDVLVERARDLGVADACVFEEATARPAEWMRAIDIFVLCSRSESFSNALLEAMACGCCPVGSRVGGTGELIAHNATGLLFDPGDLSQLADALCRLSADADLRSRLGEAAARFAHEHLNIDIASARLASIYRIVLGQASSAEQSKKEEITLGAAAGSSSR